MTKRWTTSEKNDLQSKKRSRSHYRPKAKYSGSSQYHVFWKPYNVLSQFSQAEGSTADTLSSFIEHKEIYPVGRLDRDSEGLLILSNDGLFQHKLCDPRFGHWRTYLVQVERTPDEEALDRLRNGVKIKGQDTRPAKVECLQYTPILPHRVPPIRKRKSVETSWLKLSLTEGMNRQVRRMTAAVGFPTLRLIRTEIELTDKTMLTLSHLQPGQLRPFSEEELLGVNEVKQNQVKRSTRHVKRGGSL